MSENEVQTFRRCELCGQVVSDPFDHLANEHTRGEMAGYLTTPLTGEEIAEEVLHGD